MIKAEELSEFLRKKETICNSVESCEECPITEGKERCTNVNLTQKQVDLIMAWKSPVDWSKVPIDTRVVVWDVEARKHRRYFAKYQDGKIYTYPSGATSWSCEFDHLIRWGYGRIAEED